ncbi:MAG TPA: metallophosphoesterase [Acidimicrobiales bacterium]|nr:metallophosphoesterase [Acidimicrobiales bacterium]
MPAELTTLAPDEAVFFDGTEPIAFAGLDPDTDYDIDGLSFRTLRQPGGSLLSTIATVNDVHFGETECGVIEGTDIGPTYRSLEGEDPYPETMNRGAIAEIVGLDPDLVVVKGDLTANGTEEELRAFEDAYLGAFPDRLLWVRGNHESYHHVRYASDPVQVRHVEGATVVLLDTSVDGLPGGALTVQQLDELDQLGADSDVPVLVMGHHHCWSPASRARPEGQYFGIQPEWSERLVEVFARRPRLVGYFAGHTHQNRVRRFEATGSVPFAEVSCVKDHPGAWAEYRVFEGGIVQVFRRISAPDALVWSERTRDMYGGTYHDLCFGSIDERCFVFGES